jgi:hypothetical protein
MIIEIDKLKIRKKRLEGWINANPNWYAYFNSYLYSINKLAQNCRGAEIDLIPLMYLIRHAFELGLKACMNSLKEFIPKKNKFKCGHNLKDQAKILATRLKEIKENYSSFPQPVIEEIDQFEKLLSTLSICLDEVDKNSERFRYPLNKSGYSYFESNEYVFVYKYLEMLNEIDKYLRFSELVISECVNHHD